MRKTWATIVWANMCLSLSPILIGHFRQAGREAGLLQTRQTDRTGSRTSPNLFRDRQTGTLGWDSGHEHGQA